MDKILFFAAFCFLAYRVGETRTKETHSKNVVITAELPTVEGLRTLFYCVDEFGNMNFVDDITKCTVLTMQEAEGIKDIINKYCPRSNARLELTNKIY